MKPRVIPALMRAAVAGALVAALMPVTTSAAEPLLESPNTCQTATSNSPLNTWTTERISSAADQDWYRFSLTSPAHVIATLGVLPKNYRLDIWATCGAVIASSTASGTQFEQIYKGLPAGTYLVRVMSQDGGYSSSPYALRFRVVPEQAVPLEHTSWTDATGKLHVAGEVLNNTGGNITGVRVRLAFYDAGNAVIGGASGGVALPIVQARGRSPFHVAVPRPAGYHHYAVSIAATPTSAGPLRGLGVSARSAYTDASGDRHYGGTVANANSVWVAYPRVTVILYNSAGGILNVRTAPGPSRVAPRASTTFDAVFADHFTPENRRGYYSSGAIATGCAPAYPTICIPPPPPDLDCGDITARNFRVYAPDPHGFDGDYDGVGCETTVAPPPPPSSTCDPAYPTVCIPSPPPDLDCPDISARNFKVLSPDPHRFDGDGDGVGCET